MKRLAVIMVVLGQFGAASSAWAQTGPKPNSAKRADACAPIGRTEDGKLVYAMKCETIPKPVAPPTPPQAAAQPAPEPAAEPEPETQRSGVFGWSYDRRPK
ncbi:hypothetical protein [Bradyrhizobium sp. SRS-191]|uniref:hypothetical protein n=1 Tax=Bradyrhizobium sp. SRS-191 TaxID=2962606 RepID=UPI00211DC3F6|nr:hypothetical protein [Bradyrhizobium sp. SRS-191]